jgi:tetratricopeptide (TPR) repeat protein
VTMLPARDKNGWALHEAAKQLCSQAQTTPKAQAARQALRRLFLHCFFFQLRAASSRRTYERGIAPLAGALALLLATGVAAAAPPDSPREILRQSIDLYVVGRYQEAADKLRPLVESKVLKDRADQLEALRTYGISLYLSGARPGAERAFRGLLQLDPGSRLDPSFVRPEVVEFFESVRRRYQLELKQVERKGGKSVVPNLLPPWGQFRNGHRVKGYLLLSGEVGFGATSITTAALLWHWKDDTGQFHDKEAAYRPLSILNYVSFGLTVALVIYGVVDGLYYYYLLPAQREGERTETGGWGPNRLPSAELSAY